MTQQWWYVKGEDKIGPFTQEALLELLNTQQISADTLVWTAGRVDWARAGDAPELAPNVLSAPTEMASQIARTPEYLSQTKPWPRLWARLLDCLIWSVMVGLVFGILADIFVPQLLDQLSGRFMQIGLNAVLLLPALVLLDAASMALFGTTPGKALTGVHVLHNGQRLSFAIAAKRNLMVWWRGLGCGLPLINLLTIINSESELRENGKTAWDAAYGTTVKTTPVAWRTFIAGAIVVISNVAHRLL